MDAVFFETDSLRLSMRSPETGKWLESNVYTLEGVTNADGSLRQMSIGQLVMAVCLARACELEDKIVDLTTDMATNTDKLDYYSGIENDIANWQSANPTGTLSVGGFDATRYKNLAAVLNDSDARVKFLSEIGMDTSATSWDADDVDTMMEKIEQQMDSLNTYSQEQLIELQSLTSKRDDTFSLISNVLKSLQTVLTGNANNL